MKKLFKMCSVALVGALLAFGIVACGGSSTTTTDAGSSAPAAAADATTYKVGVIQLVEHDALDAANKGFVDVLNEAGINYEIDQQNAQGDQSACQTIATTLVNNDNDLILAIATPAAQAVAGATTEIPIVSTAITDFADSGLVEANDAPGGNVTGSSDLTPVGGQIAMIPKILPEAKTVGVLYCSAEANSELQAEMAHVACEENGLEAVDYTVADSNEIQSVVESMAGKVDVIYIPTDNTIAAGATTVGMVAEENSIPVVAGEEGIFDGCGLCTYTIDYYELGRLAGEMAVRILTGGADPATMPIEYYPDDKLELLYNEELAEKYGIDASVWETL